MLPTEIPSVEDIMMEHDVIMPIRSTVNHLTISDRIAKVFKPDIITLDYLTIVFNRNMERVVISIDQLCNAIHGSSAANTTEHIELKKSMTDFEAGIVELKMGMNAMRADMTAMRVDIATLLANKSN